MRDARPSIPRLYLEAQRTIHICAVADFHGILLNARIATIVVTGRRGTGSGRVVICPNSPSASRPYYSGCAVNNILRNDVPGMRQSVVNFSINVICLLDGQSRTGGKGGTDANSRSCRKTEIITIVKAIAGVVITVGIDEVTLPEFCLREIGALMPYL